MSRSGGQGHPIDRRLFLAGLGASLLVGCTSGTPRPSGESDTSGASGTSAVVSAAATPTAPAGRSLGGLMEAIQKRRSARSFTAEGVADRDVALMAWAAQGITDVEKALRAAPSAMAAYPLRLYVATEKALLLYEPIKDAFKTVRAEDMRPDLYKASGQSSVSEAPVVFVVTGNYGLLKDSMGDKAERCVHLEAGHASQNLMLTATSLGLAGVTAGAFEDSIVQDALGLRRDEVPFYLIPIGHRA